MTVVFVAVVGTVLPIAIWILVRRQDRPTSAPNANLLSFNARATYTGYKEGTRVAGVEWQKEYADIRLVIQSNDRHPIFNLNVTVNTVDPIYVFMGMEQTSKIPGVEFHYSSAENRAAKILSHAGMGQSIEPHFDERASKTWHTSSWCKISCPRLESREELKITAVLWKSRASGVLEPHIIGIAPDILRIEGSYETCTSQGNRSIPIDRMLEIKH